MKTKRISAIILTVCMLLSLVPISAMAADPIALTKDNITVYPTLKGETYFGQAIGDNYTLTGGEVQYNSEVVPGRFELADAPDYVPVLNMNTGTYTARINFIPDDETAYTGFQYERTQYNILWTTPIIITPPTVDTTVDSGTRLAKVTITQGTLKNPYSGEIFEGDWVWTSRRTQITASGYQEATLSTLGYESITIKIFVQLTGDDSTIKTGTIIEELPAVVDVPNLGDDWSTVVLSGGKAVDDVNGLEVPGKFTISKTGTITKAGDIVTDILFTPDDTEKYFSSTSTITITVNKVPVRFVDENGNEIIPEIELGYNTNTLEYNTDQIKNLLAPYANCGADKFYCNWRDLDGKDLAHADDYLEIGTTKEYTIRGLSYDSDNYAPAMLTFKLKVVPRKLIATVRFSGTSIKVQTNKPLTEKLYGTFEYYANGEKIGTSQITTTTDATGFDWKPAKSGVYDITVKYVPGEKDVYYFDDTTVEDMEIICAWGVTVEGGTVKVSTSYKESGSFKYGEDVSVRSSSNASFSHWIVTDSNGNEIEIDGFDVNKSYNTFKMPDFNVRFKAVELTKRNITCVNCFVKNAVGTADAPVRYKGQTVSIGIDEAALPFEKFAGWEITDANGNAYLPEGMTEEALMNINLEFTMPDFDITVKAKNVDDEKGDGFFAQIKAFFENLFAGDGTDTEECPVLKWLCRIIELIVAFFTGFFNGLASKM